jgi:amino acid permease
MFQTNHRGRQEKLVRHNGIFRKQISTIEASALVLGATIGAGILGIPYAVAQVGLTLGLLYILVLGFLTIGLNILVGEIAVRTSKDMQLVGFAGKYLGKSAKIIMSILTYLTAFGVLLIYVIGEGEILSNFFGGGLFFWGFVFWCFGSLLIFLGLKTLKVVETFLVLGILMVIVLISAGSIHHIDITFFDYNNFANLLLPYGVVLFAFSGAASIPEAHCLLKNNEKSFKRSLIYAGIVSIIVYSVFTIIVVGVTGAETTQIATIGLGLKTNQTILLLGNLFAFLAMGTSFLLGGLALRDSLYWDFKLSTRTATLLTCGIPLLLFVFGLRGFVATIDLVGGVFVSLQMLLLILIYWKAKQAGDLPVSKYKVHHAIWLVALLVLAFTIGAIYSIVKLF